MEKKVKNQKQKLIQVATTQFESKIKEYARALSDEQMRDLQNEDFVSKEIVYHRVWRVEYQKKFECPPRKQATTPDTKKWHISRENHRDAFEALRVIVDENILENMEIRLSSDLNYQYNILPREIGGLKYSGTTHTTQRLEEELGNLFIYFQFI